MRFPFLSLSLAVSIALAGCSNDSTPSVSPTAPAATAKAPVKADARNHDESSYAQPQLVVIKDLALDLKLDFDAKQIGGTATYTLEWKDKAAKQLVLDTRELSTVS